MDNPALDGVVLPAMDQNKPLIYLLVDDSKDRP